MKILLTGVAGFIGSHTCEALLKRRDEVVGVDNFDPFYARSIKEQNLKASQEFENFHLIEGDLAEDSVYERLKNETFDAIIHLAAKAGVRPSIEDPLGYERANVHATVKLLKYAVDKDVSHFVFASSSSVYGENPNYPWREDEPELRPISPYAATKLAGEGMGHVFSHLYDLKFTALRFFTVYGPRQRPDLAIHKFTKLISDETEIPFFGDGKTSRDYTFIEDIVSGVILALDRSQDPYSIFNLGNDKTITLSEMVKTISETLGKKVRMKKLPSQPGDVPLTCANISRSREAIGYQPETTFRDGIVSFVKWFREQTHEI